ncbi:MAG: hypothetical protein HY552_05715 [Elusimicrobia bacterium]|nr:hypothetical protein [Elusimicrobiota bacterium]
MKILVGALIALAALAGGARAERGRSRSLEAAFARTRRIVKRSTTTQRAPKPGPSSQNRVRGVEAGAPRPGNADMRPGRPAPAPAPSVEPDDDEEQEPRSPEAGDPSRGRGRSSAEPDAPRSPEGGAPRG